MSVLAFLNDKVRAIASTEFGRSLLNAVNPGAARESLGLGSIATQADSNVNISGGTVSNTRILLPANSRTGAGSIYRISNTLRFRDSADNERQLQEHSSYLENIRSLAPLASPGQVPQIGITGDAIVFATPFSQGRQTFSDVDHQILYSPAPIIVVAQTGAMTAARSATLPSSSPTGQVIEIRQEGQCYGNCLDLSIFPAGSDRIEGMPQGQGIVMPWGCSSIRLIRNGPNASYEWSVQADRPEPGLCYDLNFTGGVSGFSSSDLQANIAGSGSSANLDGLRQVVTLSTGTTTSGRGGIRSANIFSAGFGEISLKARLSGVNALSNATENFYVMLGLASTVISASVPNWIGWYYNHSANAGAWRAVSSASSVDSSINSEATVGTNQDNYTELAFWIAGDGSAVRFFLNGSQLGSPITTNIPLSTVSLALCLNIFKLAGTTGRNIRCSRLAIQNKSFIRL